MKNMFCVVPGARYGWPALSEGTEALHSHGGGAQYCGALQLVKSAIYEAQKFLGVWSASPQSAEA